MGSRAGGLLGTSAPQAAEPSEKIGTITRSAVHSLGQGTVLPSPPRSLGNVFSYRQQLSGSRSRVSGCENLPSSPCLGQLKLFCRAQRRTQRRPKGHCVTAEPGCGQEGRLLPATVPRVWPWLRRDGEPPVSETGSGDEASGQEKACLS